MCFKQISENGTSLKFHHGIDVSEMASEMKNTSSDSFHKCGDFLPCYKDRDVILKMQGEAPALAVKYTLVILSCYLIGLVILWIHYVKQKYGEITLYDMYMELCPRNFSDGSEGTLSSQDEEKNYGEGTEDNSRSTRPIELTVTTVSYHQQNGNNKMVTFSTKMSRVSEEATEDLQQTLSNNESATVGQNSCNGGTPVVNNGYEGREGSPQILTLAETEL